MLEITQFHLKSSLQIFSRIWREFLHIFKGIDILGLFTDIMVFSENKCQKHFSVWDLENQTVLLK